MNIEELKEAVNTFEKFRTCGVTECLLHCTNCPNNYSYESLDKSVDVAIKVINDVVKQMEKL